MLKEIIYHNFKGL